MPMYAPGCEMDRVYRPPNNRNNRSKSKLPIVLIFIVVVFIFAPSFSQQPIEVVNTNSYLDQLAYRAVVDFSLDNKTIGIIFNPQYTITAIDESGNVLCNETITACNYLLPKDSINVHKEIPLQYLTGIQYNISVQCRTFRPVGF